MSTVKKASITKASAAQNSKTPHQNGRLKPMHESSPRVQRRRLRVEESLRDAARKVLEEKGWVGCATQDILDEADLSRATLYNHYPSKEALIGELLDEIITQLQVSPERQQILHPTSPVSIRESLYKSYERWYSFVRREQRLFRALAVGISVSDELAAKWQKLVIFLIDRVAGDLQISLDEGIRLRHGNNIKTVAMIMGNLQESMVLAGALQDDFQVEATATVMTQIYWDTVYRHDDDDDDEDVYDYISTPTGLQAVVK